MLNEKIRKPLAQNFFVCMSTSNTLFPERYLSEICEVMGIDVSLVNDLNKINEWLSAERRDHGTRKTDADKNEIVIITEPRQDGLVKVTIAGKVLVPSTQPGVITLGASR